MLLLLLFNYTLGLSSLQFQTVQASLHQFSLISSLLSINKLELVPSPCDKRQSLSLTVSWVITVCPQLSCSDLLSVAKVFILGLLNFPLPFTLSSHSKPQPLSMLSTLSSNLPPASINTQILKLAKAEE